MNKVTTINLNGKAYQIEEGAFGHLSGYLEEAAKKLEGNPDKEEIMADLEQAIAEKCNKFLNPHKNVVSASEIGDVLKEMGPVNHTTDSKENPEGGKENTDSKKDDAPKRLYQIKEGAVITGVCNGLAAYFNMDVTLVRIIFVALTIITHGAWILVYFVMSLIVPKAVTGEEKAAAYGAPFNAQELMNRARENWSTWSQKDWGQKEWSKKEWKHNLREQKRRWKAEQKYNKNYFHNHHPILESLIGMAWIVFFIFIAIFISHHTTEIAQGTEKFVAFVKHIVQSLQESGN